MRVVTIHIPDIPDLNPDDVIVQITSDEQLAPPVPVEPIPPGVPWPEVLKAIRAHRERMGIPRAALAVSRGLADSTLRNLETGRHLPTGHTWQRLANDPRFSPLGLADLWLALPHGFRRRRSQS